MILNYRPALETFENSMVLSMSSFIVAFDSNKHVVMAAVIIVGSAVTLGKIIKLDAMLCESRRNCNSLNVELIKLSSMSAMLSVLDHSKNFSTTSAASEKSPPPASERSPASVLVGDAQLSSQQSPRVSNR